MANTYCRVCGKVLFIITESDGRPAVYCRKCKRVVEVFRYMGRVK